MLQHRLWAVDPKPISERDPLERSELVVTVALSTSELNATLNRLALVLALLAPAIWLVAAVCGRWIVRRALEPLEKMAREARALGPGETERRLTVSPSGDELTDLASTFNALLDQLFDAYDRQKRFAGDAAHQLRTPLTVLEGQIDVALRKPRTSDEYAGTLRVLQGQVHELSQIIESLLFLARSSDAESRVALQPIELAGWMREYLEKWRSHSRWSDFALNLPGECSVETSPALLAQVLDNVVGNAAKYSPAGTQIQVSLVRTGNGAAIEVGDQGIGVAAAEAEAIFRPFYRTTAARQSGQVGTGLGLTIAARMMQAIGGKIECRSQTDRGTVFTLQLPLAKTPERPADLSSRFKQAQPASR